MDNRFVVSPSPHVHSGKSTSQLMLNVVLALMPAFAVSIYYFGVGAIIVTLISVLSCVLFEYLIQKFIFKVKPTISDCSAVVTGLLLAFNVPSNLPWYIIVLGSLFAIGVAKMSFGGLGNNIFNPAIAARIFLLISFPVQMTSWPLPVTSRLQYIDAITGPTPLAIIKEGVKNGQTISQMADSIPSHMQLFMGLMGGSLGEIAAFALLIGFAWLLITRVITWHIPVSIFTTIFVFTGILWLINPGIYADPVFHLLTGGVMLGAIFMATDYVTSPMHPKGMWIYGIGIGALTVIIRVWGSYPEGVSFAILIMNAFVPLINRFVKPKRFGAAAISGK
ncbi:MAG TPA: RnfABCDGE type electron transport complex subunit D [Tenuifilaceae bacterium]|mgnify:FL=1|nr:RnfABCDGE type electron transport complex subunit D [Bacteroidales bacterium]HOC35787.1 RnfABCDGE type electron transport complex subunit D [Tenuifilaceae bacterium]NLI87018.1 RnfABCDGE type electron transport complex subunit D [Bacteroidales bacterium]HPS03957.1 RnfABCDGE type electron transport complex subunit D [Tenuifilaceae bacterium]HQM04488.1 RnfABCDGE type electron transport complex subunit D [Tenuifilaceae bacterium]